MSSPSLQLKHFVLKADAIKLFRRYCRTARRLPSRGEIFDSMGLVRAEYAKGETFEIMGLVRAEYAKSHNVEDLGKLDDALSCGKN
ncbi:hypothetical protein T484DRAFT_1759983 [Baffinella frigidus]|nr:hypothetical protein T484DRAFT_1759983 [Cryptophyta sp. CCMP2293]